MDWTLCWRAILIDFGEFQQGVENCWEGKMQMLPNTKIKFVRDIVCYFWAPVVFHLLFFPLLHFSQPFTFVCEWIVWFTVPYEDPLLAYFPCVHSLLKLLNASKFNHGQGWEFMTVFGLVAKYECISHSNN